MKKLLIRSGLTLAMTAGSMFGAILTQTFTTGTQTFELNSSNASLTLNNFQSMPGYVAGDILNSVTLEVVISESLQSLSVQNTASGSQMFSFFTGSNFSYSGSIATADRNLVKNALISNAPGSTDIIDLYNTGTLTYGAGETKTFAPPVLNFTDDSGAVGLNIANYLGTGTFTFTTTSATGDTVTGAGGNFNSNQVTQGAVAATIVYNYTAPTTGAPEPATMTLFGSALLGIGFFARKRIKK